jgi:hypothetical protein
MDRDGVVRKKHSPSKAREKVACRAALEYERTERQRQSERLKEEAGKGEGARRERAVAKARTAFDTAKREHDARSGPSRPSAPHSKFGRNAKALAGTSKGKTGRRPAPARE